MKPLYMTPHEFRRLEEVRAVASSLKDSVGPDLYGKAQAEILRGVPPWAQEGLVTLDAEAIQILMIAGWLRGYAARREMDGVISNVY